MENVPSSMEFDIDGWVILRVLRKAVFRYYYYSSDAKNHSSLLNYSLRKTLPAIKDIFLRSPPVAHSSFPICFSTLLALAILNLWALVTLNTCCAAIADSHSPGVVFPPLSTFVRPRRILI